jgi:nitrate/nitrite transporter NarK
MVRGYFDLMIVRFSFGAAEAGAFPSIARGLAVWFHTSDRGRVTGIMWMGARLGGAMAPALAALFIGWVGWRMTFSIFGVIGAIWCVFFWRWYRDNPSKHPAATKEDLKYAHAHSDASYAGEPVRVPWRRMFLSGNLWSLFWLYFATSYGFWFLLTWLPTYLIREHGLSAQRAGFYAGLPLAVGAVSCVAGGTLSDWIVRRTGNLVLGRRVVGITGYVLTAAGFILASMADTAFAAILWLMVAEAGLDLAVPVAWAACLETGGRFGGTATGFMNTASSISAFISPLAAAWLFARYGSFDAMLMSAGVVYLVSSLFWFKINPAEPVKDF